MTGTLRVNIKAENKNLDSCISKLQIWSTNFIIKLMKFSAKWPDVNPATDQALTRINSVKGKQANFKESNYFCFSRPIYYG